MAEIDVVFLDVGGVVLEIDWRRTFASAELEFNPALVERISSTDAFHRFERGQISPDDYFAELASLTGNRLSQERLVRAWNALIVGELPGIHRVFDEFAARVSVCALSNTNMTHVIDEFPRYPAMARFHRVFTSCELGHRKPDPQIYLDAAVAMDVDPKRALFIDDNAQNVEGARRVGLHAFQSVNDPQRTLEVLRGFKVPR